MRSIQVLALLALAAAPLQAQRVSPEPFFRPGGLALSIYAGGGAFTTLYRAPDGTAPGTTRDISAHTGPALAAEVVWWASPSFGVRLHGSWLPSRFDVRPAATTPVAPGTLQGAVDSADFRGLNVWLADVSVLVRPPFTFGRMAPYAILGGGLVSYGLRGDDPLPPGLDAGSEARSHTAAAAVIGLGAVVPLERERLMLSFALTNHMGRPLGPTTDDAQTTSHVRLLAGLTLPLR